MSEMNLDAKADTDTEVTVSNTCTVTSVSKKKKKKKTPNVQGKYWMFTINNYTPKDVALMGEWAATIKQLVVAMEVGESGTPHLQGYLEWFGTKRAAAVKKYHKKAHWELSNSKDARSYGLKDDSDVLYNTFRKKAQGKRTDIEAIKQAIADGCDIKEMWNAYPGTMVRYHKGIEEGSKYWNPKRVKMSYDIKQFCEPPLDLSTPVVLWGDAGIGKTSFALAHFKNPLLIRTWDAVGELTSDHDGMVFDDVSYTSKDRSIQINVLDMEHESRVHIRYKDAIIPQGMRRIFCTNARDGQIFDLMDGAIRRRVVCKEVIKLF